MHTPRLFLLLPVLGGLVAAVVMTVVTGNALGLLFAATLPLTALASALTSRHARRLDENVARDARRNELQRCPSMHEVATTRAEVLPAWLIPGAAESQPARIRIGVVQPERVGTVVHVNPGDGVRVIGDRVLAPLVQRNLEWAVRWMTREPHAVRIHAADDTSRHTRWLIEVDSRGVGVLTDLLAREPEVTDVELDVVLDDDHARLERGWAELSREPSESEVSWRLEHDGTHALVSGVTGSGKTEFLVSWLTHEMHQRSADELAVVIVDFKGGGGFARLTGWPHVRHLVTNREPERVDALLAGLHSLSQARETLLAEHACADISQVNESMRPPRVYIVIDEYRAFLEQYPEGLELCTDIVARGRAFGIHLIVATQRFTQVAADAFTTNCGVRIALRAGDARESELVLGATHAFDRSLQAGEGFVVFPGSSVRRVRLPVVPLHPSAGRSMSSFSLEKVELERLWLEPMARRPSLAEVRQAALTSALIVTRQRSILVGLRADHAARLWQPVSISGEVGKLILVAGGHVANRRECVQLIAQQLQDVRECETPDEAWDASVYESPGPLVLHDYDALVARTSAAWREELAERCVEAVHQRVGRGEIVVVSLAAEILAGGLIPGALATRLRQLNHELILLDARVPGVARLGEVSVTLALPVVEVGPEREPRRPRAQLEDALLITPYVSRWRSGARADVCARLQLSVEAPEAILLGRVQSAPGQRVFIEGCSPAEARSLRLSSYPVSPPLEGTVLEVGETGEYRRVWLPDGL